MGLVVLAGEPGSGKSLLALDWSLRMAHGVASWHARTLQPGPVLYLAGEGHRSLAARSRAWLAAHPAEAAQHELLMADMPDLASAAGLALLRAAVDHRRPALVVVDTLGLAVLGVEENDAKTMGPAMASLGALRDRCSILVLHHLGKNHESRSLQARVRGSGAITAAADAVLLIERDTSNRVKLRVGKMRDGEAVRALRLELAPITLEDGSTGVHLIAGSGDTTDDESDPQAELAAAAKSAQDALRGLGGTASSVDVIAKAMGGRVSSARAGVRRAVDLGLIDQNGTARRPIYAIPQGGTSNTPEDG